jgi:hypothetical protein
MDRIYDLMMTEPEKLWGYDELGERLGKSPKTVCTRCLELRELNLIDTVSLESGKLRGRTTRLFIKRSLPKVQYPEWLDPPLSWIPLLQSHSVAVASHHLED